MMGKSQSKSDPGPIPEGLNRKPNGQATPSYEELLAEIERLKAAQQASLKLKVSEKGAASLYGLGRWPVTLYRGQWERLLAAKEEIETFLQDHAAELSTKD